MTDVDIAAVDIGYGESKVAWTDKSGPVLESFRSIAARAPNQDLESALYGYRPQAVGVTVNGEACVVGRDAMLLGDPLAVQVLHADYIHTLQYRACFHAALAMTPAQRIATLVTGLPVYQYAERRAELARLLTGTHRITVDRTVTVDRVLVVPQPLGGMLDVVTRAGLGSVLDAATFVIVDVGQGTTDWVTFTQGRAAVKRSGSHAAGIAAIIEGIRTRLLAKYHGAPRAIDLAEILKRGEREAMVGATRINLQTEVAVSAAEVIATCMNAMQNIIHTFADINYVGLIGGGADLIRPTLSRALAQTQAKVLTVTEPQFANIRGYLLLADRLAARA